MIGNRISLIWFRSGLIWSVACGEQWSGWVGGWSGGVAELVEVVYTDTNTAIHPSTPNQISTGQNLIIKHPSGVSKSDGTAALKYLPYCATICNL